MRPKLFGQTLNAPVDCGTRSAVEKLARDANTTMAQVVRELLKEALKVKGLS